MLSFGSATQIYLAIGFTDMRKGYDGLYGLVKSHLELEPTSGHLFVFCNQYRNRIKILYWDGSGLWVYAKRLEKGRFTWPEEPQENKSVRLNREELALLLGGIDLNHARRKAWFRKEI